MTSYPSQAGGRNSVCGGAEAGGNQGGEGTGWCCEQKPGQRVSGAAVTAPGSLLCHIAAQWIEGESRRGCAGQFSSVQSLSHDQLFATPWTAALQASLSITSSRSLRKLMSIESVMPSNHFILCRPLLLLPSIFPSIWVFPMSQLFASGGQSIGVSASTLVLPVNTQDWSPLGWTGWISLQSKGLQVFSGTTVQKHQFF